MKRTIPLTVIAVMLIGLFVALPASFTVAQEGPLSTEERVEDLLSQMTLDEKIGQMTLVEKGSIKGPDVTQYTIGGVLSGGGGTPAKNSAEGWRDMVKDYQDAALQTRLGIPLIWTAACSKNISFSKPLAAMTSQISSCTISP